MDAPARILVVDDDYEICVSVAEFLRRHDFTVDTLTESTEVLPFLRENVVDLLVIDLMMPNINGLDLVKQIRQHFGLPILMLTAVTDELERVVSLESGVDDYINKPFNLHVLRAHIQALLRRFSSLPGTPSKVVGSQYAFSGWRLDSKQRSFLAPDGVEMPLSTAGFELLLAFVTHPNKVLNRDDLLNLTHRVEGGAFDRRIDVLVSRLRQKIEQDPKNPQLIKTVRNRGYLFTGEVKVT